MNTKLTHAKLTQLKQLVSDHVDLVEECEKLSVKVIAQKFDLTRSAVAQHVRLEKLKRKGAAK